LVVVRSNLHAERVRHPRRESEELIDADDGASQRTHTLHAFEASAPQIHVRTTRVRIVGTGQVATAERDVLEPRVAKISTCEYRRFEPEARELRHAEVCVVQAAVDERRG